VETVVLLAAEAREFSGLLRHTGRPVRLQWPLEYSGAAELNGKRLLLLAGGPGPRLAGRALDLARQHYPFHGIVSTGFCGGLDTRLRPGSIFVATRVETPDRASSFPARSPITHSEYASGPLISTDRVIQSVEEKRELRATGAAAVDMEAAAAGSRAAAWQLPFYCVRAVTDAADESFLCDFNAMRDADGRFRRSGIIWAACRQPRRLLPELLLLRRRARLASLALGDFLANCQF